jgi:hypothetical protein
MLCDLDALNSGWMRLIMFGVIHWVELGHGKNSSGGNLFINSTGKLSKKSIALEQCLMCDDILGSPIEASQKHLFSPQPYFRLSKIDLDSSKSILNALILF